jgi:SAM-dependent methyltransferase
VGTIRSFFDSAYTQAERYWWKGEWRYSTDPDSHPASLLTQLLLRYAKETQPGRALDLGCGEGADAIRLAKLGWDVEAVELSEVGAEKAARFAREEGVDMRVHCIDALDYVPKGLYNIVICNGVLHYINDKARLLDKMASCTTLGGCNVVSLWSDYTPVPEPHRVVPTFPDSETGVVTDFYRSWRRELLYFERAKLEASHADFPAHMHSYIKVIAIKPFATRAETSPGRE